MTDYELQKLSKLVAKNLVQSIKDDDELLDELYPPRYMSIQEAADYLNLPVNTIYAKIREIPHEKVGKRLLFTDRGLSRWVRRKNIEISPALRKAE
jgi:excisionase family DNA binding protein